MIYEFVSETAFPASLVLIVVLCIHLRIERFRRFTAEARAEELRQVLQNGMILNADKEHPVLLIDSGDGVVSKPKPLPAARIHRIRFAVVEDPR